MLNDRTAPIRDFRGLDELYTFGTSPDRTSSLDNVTVRNGEVSGRKGLALWDGISTAAGNVIVGMWDFYAPATAAATFLRMTTDKMEKWNDAGNSWDDITGTALNGNSLTRPSFANLSDEGFMVFTNEGADRPRRWNGSGNTATLGGTPPYAKWLCPYVGFLFLFNTSVDGTFGAVADSITAYYSDQPDVSWDLCENNTLIFDETAGEIRAADTFGENLIVFKADALIRVKFVGGQVRFDRKRLPFAHGILAPMSLKKLGELGLVFLATDRNLYITDGFSVKPLPLNIQRSLRDDMDEAKAPYVSAAVDLTRETYHLLYQRNGTTYYDGRLSWNYRTGEFTRARYASREFTRIHAFRQTNNHDTQVVAAEADKKVYEMDVGRLDVSTAISRYYDLDWTFFDQPGGKYLMGANLLFSKAPTCRVRVSVAEGHSPKFQYPKLFTLRPKFTPSETNVRVNYELPSPIYGTWFKLRIEFLHLGSADVATLLEIDPLIIPVHSSPADQPKQPQSQGV